MIQNKFCIIFAGVVGCSKTPISNFLSTKLNLPVFNNDAIRTEVIEDLGVFDGEEHVNRRNSRLKEILESGISFICDASVDREWPVFKKMLSEKGYRCFVISIDLSKDLIVSLYKAKGYFESLERVDELIQNHDVFLNGSNDDIDLHISDLDFKNRCELSYVKAAEWIKNNVL
jgi:hypothetical protein